MALGRSHLPEAGIQLALTVGLHEGSETGPLGAVRLGSQKRTELSPGGTRQVVVAGPLPREPSPLCRGGRMATERVVATAVRRGCKCTMKVTHKPALARKVPGGGVENKF